MPYLRSRFPSLYRFAAFAALLAMLVPAATSLVHHPMAAQALVHICGMDMGAHDSGDRGKVPAHQSPSCPICQSLHFLAGGFVPPNLIAVTAIPFTVAIDAPAERISFARLIITPQARPRAPPAFV
jgi:hypothetical protein